jgi:hypothetical protein
MLTTTISQKVDAEEKLTNEKSKNYEYKQMYEEIYLGIRSLGGKRKI